MKYPQLNSDNQRASGTAKVTTRDMIQAFRGYNHNLRIGDDEFWNTENVTLDLYPVLSQRKTRGLLAESYDADGGIFASEKLCWINGRKLYYDGEIIKRDLDESLAGVERQFAAMGAYIVIFPDKIWFNSNETPISVRDLGASYTSSTNVTYALCDINGAAYNAPASDTAPANPSNGDYWIDTAVTPNVLKRYSSLSLAWADIPTTYIKISAPNIGRRFQIDDVLTFSGGTVVNGSQQIYAKGDDYIVTTGMISETIMQSNPLTVSRDVPDLDYITESNNRLWGCSTAKHEIYACKLGDPTNWYTYTGLSSDSYAATIGSAGPFTGAATLGGNVLFFKADCFHKVYGSQPSNYQVIEVTARGVQAGSSKSLAVVNEILYYLSRDGICAYDGSLPVNVSRQFGQEKYSGGVAGSVNSKYYISMKDEKNVWHMFVYDTEKGAWIHEDNTQAESFTYYDGDLYFVEKVGDEHKTRCVKGTVGEQEKPFEWMAESGDIGLSLADQKYVTRIVLRMEISTGGYVELHTSYDGENYELKERMYSQSLDSVYAAITPRRCDHMRIKLVGYGAFKLYSMSKTIEQGSEINGRI